MSWHTSKLEDICQIKKGEQLNKLELESSGQYPCINGGIRPSGYTDKWNRLENTITISEGGNSCGFVNFLESKFWSGGHCYTVLNISEKIEQDFLYYALKGRESLIMDLRVGSGLPNIQQRAIKKFSISYPDSKVEQTAIAEVLGKIDSAIEKTNKLIEKQKRIKQGLMQDLLTKGIDEHGNIRNEKTHRFKHSPLGRIPEEWRIFSLRELTTVIVDGVHHTPKYVESGIPFITISDMTKGDQVDFSDTRFITEKDHNIFKKRVLPKVGDVLVTKDGTLGKARIVLIEYPEFSIFVSVALLRPKHSLCISEFIWNFFDSNKFETQLGNLSAGTGLKHIHLEHFNKFLLSVPNLAEQKQIFREFNKLLAKLELEKRKLEKLETIKKGLMQDLLTGKKSIINLISE